MEVPAPGKWRRLKSLCCGLIFTAALLANPTRPNNNNKQTRRLNLFEFEHNSHFVDKDLLKTMTDLLVQRTKVLENL